MSEPWQARTGDIIIIQGLAHWVLDVPETGVYSMLTCWLNGTPHIITYKPSNYTIEQWEPHLPAALHRLRAER